MKTSRFYEIFYVLHAPHIILAKTEFEGTRVCTRSTIGERSRKLCELSIAWYGPYLFIPKVKHEPEHGCWFVDRILDFLLDRASSEYHCYHKVKQPPFLHLNHEEPCFGIQLWFILSKGIYLTRSRMYSARPRRAIGNGSIHHPYSFRWWRWD